MSTHESAYEHFLWTREAAGQTDSQVDASEGKFAKPELAYGLAKYGQTDSQVGSQLHASRKMS